MGEKVKCKSFRWQVQTACLATCVAASLAVMGMPGVGLGVFICAWLTVADHYFSGTDLGGEHEPNNGTP